MNELFDTAPCGFLAFDDRGYIAQINQTACELLKYSREELLNRRFESLLNVSGRIFVQTHLFPLLKLHMRAEEIFLELLAKDNTALPVLSNSSRRESPEKNLNVFVFIPVHNRRKFEDELVAAKRHAENALKENKELLDAKAEAAVHALELDKQLATLSNMHAEMLQFNHIINHDLQECARKILMFGRLTLEENDLKYVDKVLETALRLKQINQALHSFISLGTEHEPVGQVDLTGCLMDAKHQASRQFPLVDMELHYEPMPLIEGYRDQLTLLFYHLFCNSLRFSVNKKVNIEVRGVTFETNIYKFNRRRYEYAEMLKITVSDNSQGFDEKFGSRIFGIFQKLSHEHSGIGVGLPICKKVVNIHNGEISIYSKVNEGTTVTIILPLKQQISKAQLLRTQEH